MPNIQSDQIAAQAAFKGALDRLVDGGANATLCARLGVLVGGYQMRMIAFVVTAKTSIFFTQGLPALLALQAVLAMRPARTR
jgi:hypothetical protein